MFLLWVGAGQHRRHRRLDRPPPRHDPLGAFLDPLADKVLVLGAMFALVSINRFSWVPVAIIAGPRDRHQPLPGLLGPPRPGRAGLAGRQGQDASCRRLAVGRAPSAAAGRPPTRGSADLAAVGLGRAGRPQRAAVPAGPAARPPPPGGLAPRITDRRDGRHHDPTGGSPPMRCEVVAVGTELLLGQIVDTNSSWIGEQLAWPASTRISRPRSATTSTASRRRSAIALERSRRRHRVRRPRPDPGRHHPRRDRRRDGRRAVRRPGDRGPDPGDVRVSRVATCPQNNLRQAEVPEGASADGAAAGHRARAGVPDRRPRRDGKVIYAVPGVPYEMKEMVEGTVLPDLQRRAGTVSASSAAAPCAPGARASRAWPSCWPVRIDELDASGALHARLPGQRHRGPQGAAHGQGGDGGGGRRGSWPPRSRSSRGCSASWCSAPTTSRWRRSILDLCRERGLTLATAESFTGGLIASRLTDDPRRQRRVPRVGGVLRQRGEVRRARGARRDRSCPRRRPSPWPRARAGCWAPTSRCGHRRGRSRPSRRASARRHGVARPRASTARRESMLLRLPGDRERMRQFATISVLDCSPPAPRPGHARSPGELRRAPDPTRNRRRSRSEGDRGSTPGARWSSGSRDRDESRLGAR